MNDDKRGPHGMGFILCIPFAIAAWVSVIYYFW